MSNDKVLNLNYFTICRIHTEAPRLTLVDNAREWVVALNTRLQSGKTLDGVSKSFKQITNYRNVRLCVLFVHLVQYKNCAKLYYSHSRQTIIITVSKSIVFKENQKFSLTGRAAT